MKPEEYNQAYHCGNNRSNCIGIRFEMRTRYSDWMYVRPEDYSANVPWLAALDDSWWLLQLVPGRLPRKVMKVIFGFFSLSQRLKPLSDPSVLSRINKKSV